MDKVNNKYQNDLVPYMFMFIVYFTATTFIYYKRGWKTELWRNLFLFFYTLK